MLYIKRYGSQPEVCAVTQDTVTTYWRYIRSKHWRTSEAPFCVTAQWTTGDRYLHCRHEIANRQHTVSVHHNADKMYSSESGLSSSHLTIIV